MLIYGKQFLLFGGGDAELENNLGTAKVSSKTSFVSKQPKLEPKLVSALSETRCLFQLFRFNIETGSFGVSEQPKQTKDQPKQQQIFKNINHFHSPYYKFCLFRLFRYRSETSKQKKKIGGFAKKQTKKQPKQIEFRFVSEEKKINGFMDPLIENVFWSFFQFVLTKLFVSVVSIPVQNTETNQNKPKKMFFGFAKQTEKQPKQIEFRFVSVRTEKKI
jgi:hypothetical protein